jgi:hypothetical protein
MGDLLKFQRLWLVIACLLFIGVCYFAGTKLLCGLTLRNCANGNDCPQGSQCVSVQGSLKCVSRLCRNTDRQEQALKKAMKDMGWKAEQWMSSLRKKYESK